MQLLLDLLDISLENNLFYGKKLNENSLCLFFFNVPSIVTISTPFVKAEL